METKEWRRLIKWLRATFPLSFPLTVKRAPSKRNHGVTSFDGNTIHIRVDSTQDHAGQIDTILHEYAHALAIDDAYTHKDNWGRLYAAIYTAMEQHETLPSTT